MSAGVVGLTWFCKLVIQTKFSGTANVHMYVRYMYMYKQKYFEFGLSLSTYHDVER